MHNLIHNTREYLPALYYMMYESMQYVLCILFSSYAYSTSRVV